MENAGKQFFTSSGRIYKKRKVNTTKQYNETQWYKPEVKDLAKRKKNAYIQYIRKETANK